MPAQASHRRAFVAHPLRPAAAAVPSGATPEVSIVIPVYNSADTIERLCEAVLGALRDRWDLEIILVDDGSRDGSGLACRRIAERYPAEVQTVILSRNFGEHNAVMAGLNFAAGKYCVIMDDDFQNPPSEVEALLLEAEKGFEVVYTQYATKRHSAWRNLGSWLHNSMATAALGKPRGLYLSSFKLISRFVVQQVVQYTGPDPYLDAIILRITHNIGTITVDHHVRDKGESGYTLRKLIALWSNMMVAFSVYPLRLIGVFGLVMMVIGVGYGGYTVVAIVSPSFKDPSEIGRLHAVLWFFRGSTLFVISIIGEYIGRIHRNLNAAPQFIVREHFSNNRLSANSVRQDDDQQ